MLQHTEPDVLLPYSKCIASHSSLSHTVGVADPHTHSLSLSDVEKSAHIKSFDHITMKPRKDYLGVLL